MNTIENEETETYTLGDKVDYTGYKTDSDFIEWIKEEYRENYRRKNPINEEVNTFQTLKELVNKREERASNFAEYCFKDNSDYVLWQEWQNYLKVSKE